MLKGKKVLFIGLGFYDYDHHIKAEMESQGASVDYFVDKPDMSIFGRFYKQIKSDVETNSIGKYYRSIKNNLASSYDYIFIIKAEFVPIDFIAFLKEKFSSSIFIMYQWDAIARVDGYKEKSVFFDRVFTFDRIDSEKYNLEFRPLFYKNLYLNSNPYKLEKKIDIYFSGWLHSDRQNLLSNIRSRYPELLLDFHLYYEFLPYMKAKIRSEFFGGLPIYKHFISHSSISELENRMRMARSRSILDIHHPQQSGLTMRTIEALASGCKIITTNSDVVNYDFYDADRVCIFDRESIEINSEFLDKDISPLRNDILSKYSLKSWVQDVFNK